VAKRFNRVRWLIALVFVPAAAALSRTEPDKAEALTVTSVNSRGAFFGNAGCAASGCHNANGPRGASGSEFSTWANEDPHAKAFGVLLSEAGQQMERHYRREKNADASRDQLCLKCHAPLGADKDHPELRLDAVGCEACHGSSAQWRTTHYLNDWKGKGRPGMAATKDLTTRIERCASCHVGEKGMDVDHELIAAGHPRLFFEYSAYHELLPRHWQEPKNDPSFHARAWAIGRVTAAKVALELLRDRAVMPDRWPELAEFNCYSCHRDLSGETTPPKDRTPGSLAFGSWHFAMLDTIRGFGDAYAPPQPVDPTPMLRKIHELDPKPADIAAATKPLLTALAAWQDNLKKAGDVDSASMRKKLSGQQLADWEQATHHYLALSALQRSLPPSEQRREPLMKLRDLLKFPATEAGIKINGPSRFNLNNYTIEAAKLLSLSAAADLAPKGRYTLSQGISPWAARVFANIPEGATRANVAQGDGRLSSTPLITKAEIKEGNASHCKICHAAETADYKQNHVYEFITTNPSTKWQNEDPHAKSWDNTVPANNSIAQRMENVLGYDGSLKRECLVCHAVDRAPVSPMKTKVFSNVGCEACHGNADRWLGDHVQKEWRDQTPIYKEDRGLVDLRDPVRRAAKCASCHVGNVAEGKFVTHEMYAAGHPPLLPFEPVTFSRDQPMHWRPPEQVDYFNSLDANDVKRKYFHVPNGEDSVARSLAVGAVVNLRETARTLAQAAADAPERALLDFAHFDCFACHHELELPSQRQSRGYTGTPGRPTARTLPTELVNAVLGQTKTDRRDDFRKGLQDLQLAYDRRPFGEPKAIAAAAGQLVTNCDQWLKDLDDVKYDAAGKAQLLSAITGVSQAAQWDYDTAQQFVWAARALGSYDKVGDEWNGLRQHVLLDARLGPDRRLETLLKQRLRLRYEFDPKAFATSWKQIPR
jgi:Cytochrome c554 and c-prime